MGMVNWFVMGNTGWVGQTGLSICIQVTVLFTLGFFNEINRYETKVSRIALTFIHILVKIVEVQQQKFKVRPLQMRL